MLSSVGVRPQPQFQAAGTDVEGISNDTLITASCSWAIHAPIVSLDLSQDKEM